MIDFDISFFIDNILNVSTEDLEEKLIEDFGFNKYASIFYYGNTSSPIFIFAHIDTFNTKRFGKIFEKYIYPLEIIIKKEKIIALNNMHNIYHASLGGDDRCGVYLLLLLKNIFNNKLFYLLQNDEENASYITKNIFSDDLFKNKILISIDADKNNIIKSYIKHENFYKFIDYLANKYNMVLKEKKENNYSIIDYLGDKYYDAINVGCGYFKQHTKDEYINLNLMQNSLLFLIDLIKSILNSHGKA